MAILAGFAVLVAIGWATTKAADAAWQAIRSQYQARNGRFRAQHPNSNRAAAAGAAAAASVVYGTKPALQAFRDDWRKHYGLRRDAVRAKYAPTPQRQPEPPNPTPPKPGMFDHDPNYQKLKHIREDEGYQGWLDQDLNKVDDTGRPWKPQIIPGGKETATGGNMPNLPTTEVSRVADVRRLLTDYRNHMSLESDDAAAALQRARDNERWLTQFHEQSAQVLDNDPGTSARIAALLEPAHMRVEAAKMHAQAADAALAASDQSLAGVNQHRGMEEAVQATPQASSNTAVYAGN